jgi:hypothetical protein
MMKKIRNMINIALSAVIVALGFSSCVSQKTYNAAQERINLLQAENERLQNENLKLQDQIKTVSEAAGQYRQQMEQRKVVYGPRPTNFNEKIKE